MLERALSSKCFEDQTRFILAPFLNEEKAILKITLTTKVTYIIFHPSLISQTPLCYMDIVRSLVVKSPVSVLVQVDVNYKVSHWFRQTSFPELHVKHRLATSVKSFGSPIHKSQHSSSLISTSNQNERSTITDGSLTRTHSYRFPKPPHIHS